MLLAFVLQVAGIKPEFEAYLVKELTKLAGSIAVVCLRNYIEKADRDHDEQFTFLNSKAEIVTRLTGNFDLKDVLISPDGTMAAARVETFTDSKPSNVTDVLVVNKEGLLAKTHLLNGCQICWQGNTLLCSYYDMPILRFGPDPELSGWSTKKVSDEHETYLYPDGETVWFTRNDPKLKKSFASQMNKDGSLKRSIEMGEFGHRIVRNPIGASFLFFTDFHFTGDGHGGFDSLFVKDLESETVRPICPEMELQHPIWLSGPLCLGYFSGLHQNQGQKMTFYQPKSGKSIELGPTLTSPTYAALDQDTAIVMGGNNSGKNVVYLMNPGKRTLNKISIVGVSEPNSVSACR